MGAGDFLPNHIDGFAAVGFAICSLLAPWQLTQLGVRLSAAVAWRVLPIASTADVSSTSWQRVHAASPCRTRSAGGFSAAGFSAAGLSCAAAPNASANVAANAISLFRNLQLLRPGTVGAEDCEIRSEEHTSELQLLRH